MTQESNTLWALAAAFVVAVFLTACSPHRPTSDGPSPHQERAVRPPERVRFPTKDGGLIYGELYGVGDHGVLLAHGGRFNKESWEKQAQALAKAGYQVLILHAQAFTRHPCLTMQIPTTAQLRTAIEVLKKPGERIDNHANHSLMKLPHTRLGDDYAARIEWQTIEQIARLKTVMAQLESWRDELKQAKRQCVTHHV